MRNNPNLKAERYRVDGPSNTSYGAFIVPTGSTRVQVIASAGGGWDHVSVSAPNRCPSWLEMCQIKELFFRDDEVVMQLHPAKEDYVNHHPFCLHLWRPQTNEEVWREIEEAEAAGERWPEGHSRFSPGSIPLPPTMFVGPKTVTA